MASRETKGRDLAISGAVAILPSGDGYSVCSGDNVYTVDRELTRCDCADFEYRGEKCKHIHAAEYTANSEEFIFADGDDYDDTPF